MKIFIPLSLTTLLFSFELFARGVGVVYGNDDRQEVNDVADAQIRKLSDSVVGLTRPKTLEDLGNGYSKINFKTMEQQRKVCPDERFKDQLGAMYCSGFLVSSRRVVTAGHCISSINSCKNTKFVFGYKVKAGKHPYTEIPNIDIYSCGKVIHSEYNPKEKDSVDNDFAVIELDRDVVGHDPLSLEMQSQLTMGSKVFAIGHPLGLPQKYTDNAWVVSFGPNNYIGSNLDTYTGNSGSPIFNASTLRVEGILIDGTDDFEKTKEGCKKTRVCQEGECPGELFIKISTVLDYLNLRNHPLSLN